MNVNTPVLGAEATCELSKPVTREEIYEAVHHMHPFKSPGPDGFQGIFFRQYWNITGDDVFNLVANAFATGSFDPNIAATLISLIPKVDDPRSFKDFRPISLCNTLYKIITKVLVTRLQPFLDNIIGPFQSSFLPGRGTNDNAIVLQEALHSMHKSTKKKGDVAYKIDLEKAYDNVSWNFLRTCLIDFGFPAITVKLIMTCVTTSQLSLLWNGKRLPSFAPTRGLRQGDPLSPYLFVICMEKLSHAIMSAVNQGKWKPMYLSKNGPALSHLFFADDVLLFSKATAAQAKIVAEIFTSFAHQSGLRVSVTKSRSLYSKGVPQAKRNKITSITGIRETTSFDKYLGFPMLQGRVTKAHFQFIIDKIQTRLASWKNNLLNKAGRVTLAKSVLNSIPIYYMQVAWLPQNVCDHIDKIARDFVWKGSQDRGINLVGWNTITQSKQRGGLGLRVARDMNSAMLGKLIWDMHVGKDKLWIHLLTNKYVKQSSILQVQKTNGSYTWNSIMKARDILKNGFHFRLGNGCSSFWYSQWTEFGALSKLVPYVDIHDIALTVEDVYDRGSWKLQSLYTQLPHHVLQHISRLDLSLNSDVDDAWIWSGNLEGVYTAKSGYTWLRDQFYGHSTTDIPDSWRWIWRLPGPEKIRFLVWIGCHDAIPTASMLHHRGILPSAICQRCSVTEESTLHCLRDCFLSKSVWLDLGFDLVSFFQLGDAKEWFKVGISGHNPHVFLAAVWSLWCARNASVMAGETVNSYALKLSIHNLACLILKCYKGATSVDSPPRMVCWHPSKEDTIILNVDGSSLGSPGRSGFGGLLRNGSGSWLGGFAGSIGVSNNLKAELLALYNGLLFAWNKGYRSLVCYSDSQNVLTLVASPLNKWSKYAPIIQNIKDLIHRDWLVHLVHTLREGNACADFLAKVGAASSETWIVFETPPLGLSPHLVADASRVEFVRA